MLHLKGCTLAAERAAMCGVASKVGTDERTPRQSGTGEERRKPTKISCRLATRPSSSSSARAGAGLEIKARPASVAAGGLTLAPAPSSCDALRLVPADARRFSLSFLSGPSSSFSIVRTSVSMRRFSLAAQRRAFSRRRQPVAGLRRGALERRPRLQEPVEPEQRFGANVVLQLFPLAPA